MARMHYEWIPMTLKLGTVLMTQGVSHRVKNDVAFNDFVMKSLFRHKTEDWGDLCEEDRRMNDEAVRLEKEGKDTDRIMSAYNSDKGRIWIITEYDRSYTTVLLPEEY